MTQTPSNYTYSNLKDFISYVPGDHHGNLMKVLAHIDPNGNPSFKNWTTTNFYQEHGLSKCCCEHDIIYEYRIAHKTTGDTMSIGSKCIKLFSNKMYLHTEKLKRMANPDNHFCALEGCEGPKLQKTVVDRYPNPPSGQHYHAKCLPLAFKKCYRCEKFKGYDCVCPPIVEDSRVCETCQTTLPKNSPEWKVYCYSCYLNKKQSDLEMDAELEADLKWFEQTRPHIKK